MNEIVYPGTLAAAMQSPLILPGSRLLLRGGNYRDAGLQCTLTGVTIMSYPGERAIIIPSGGARALLFDSVNDVIVKDITLDGTNLSGESIKITGTATGIKLQNLTVINSFSDALYVSGTAHDLEISGCTFRKNTLGTTEQYHGLYFSSDYAGHVANVFCNELSEFTSNALLQYDSDNNSEISIYRNYIHDNGQVGVGCYSGICNVYNNIVRDSDLRGITARYNIHRALIAYNTIVNAPNGGGKVYTSNLPANALVEIRNNLCYGSGPDVNIYQVDDNPSAEVVASNNFTTSAGDIVDVGGDDIRPAANSAAIGGGIVIGTIADDYLGIFRSTTAPTIGAYE